MKFPKGLDVQLCGQGGPVMRGVVLATRFKNTPLLFSSFQVLVRITHHYECLINRDDWQVGEEVWVEPWLLQPTPALRVLAEAAE